MKDKSTSLLLLVVLGFATWYFIDTHQVKTSDNRAAAIREQQRNASIAALVLKYNAVTNWEAGLPNQGGGEQLSINVSRALTANNRQPALFLCVMDDLTEKDGQTIAKLMPLGGPPIIDSLTLTCSSEQAIIFTGAKGYPLFAVVARCHEVQRMSDNDESFLVKGELLDAVELP